MADPREVILAEFRKFDADGDGGISEEEMTTVLKALNGENFTDDNAARLFSEIDVNNDGRVSVKEFVAWVCGGSGEVLQFAQTDLANSHATLQALVQKYTQDESAKFWTSMPRDYGEQKHYTKWIKQIGDRYERLLHEATESIEYCGEMIEKDVLSDDEVKKQKQTDFLKYLDDFAIGGNEIRTPLSLSEYAENAQDKFAALSACSAQAQKLLHFMKQGGCIPEGLEEQLLGRLVTSWKNKAASSPGGFLVAKTQSNDHTREREAVYTILKANPRDVYVGVLNGVKWRPTLLAKADSTGARTLPINEAQRHFDLLNPARLAACAMDLERKSNEIIAMLSKPVLEGEGW